MCSSRKISIMVSSSGSPRFITSVVIEEKAVGQQDEVKLLKCLFGGFPHVTKELVVSKCGLASQCFPHMNPN
jgi:hypothetical protein